MGSSVGNQEVGPSDRIWAPSGKVTRAKRTASCSAMSSVSVAKRQTVLAVVVFLLSSTAAQQEGSPVASYQTPPSTREAPSPSLVFQHSTEARQVVEQDLQNSFTEGQPDLPALGVSLYTRNPVADPTSSTVPVHIVGTSRDPSEVSGLQSSGVPVEKNRLEVLDVATSSVGKTSTFLATSYKGLGESTVATSVVKSVEKGKPGLSPNISPTSPPLPDAGSSLHLDLTPALKTTPARPLRETAPDTAFSIARPSVATILTLPQPTAPKGSPQGAQDLTGTSQPPTKISHQTHLDQKSTSPDGYVLPSTEMGFLAHQVAEDAATSHRVLGISLSSAPPMGMVPFEATHVVMEVLNSSSTATTRSVSTGSLPAHSPEKSSRSMGLLQGTVLNGQRPGGTELAMRGPIESTTDPAPRSSSWPLSSSFHGVPHTDLPDSITQLDSSETKVLAADHVSRHPSVSASVGSLKLDDATTLSASTGTAPVNTKEDTEIAPSLTSQVEESETLYGVSEGTGPSVRDLTTVSALTRKQTPSDLSTPQDFLRSEATSGFPVGNASLPASRPPRTDPVSSGGTVSQPESDATSRSPHSSPAGIPGVLSTVPLDLGTAAADNSTEAVLITHQSTMLEESSTGLDSTSWVRLSSSLGTTVEQEGLPTGTFPSPSPDAGLEWKEEISPTSELSTSVVEQVSTLDSQSEHPALEDTSIFLPTYASGPPTFHLGLSRSVETGYTSEAVTSAGVTDLGRSREQSQLKDRDGTGQVTATAGKISGRTSDQPLATSRASLSTDSSASRTSAMVGVPSASGHFVFPGKRTTSTSPPPASSTSLTTPRMTTSKESSEPEGATSASVPTSTTRSNATQSSPFLDTAGAAQPFWTTAGGTQHVGRVTGSPTTSTGRELFSRTPSEWGLSTFSQAQAHRTEVLDPSAPSLFVHSTSYRASPKTSADLSLVEAKSTVTSHPKATQSSSLLSNTTTVPAISRILPTASVSTTSAACSHIRCLNSSRPASLAPLQRTSAQRPTTSPTLPPKVLATTLGSTVGKMAGLSTKMDTPTAPDGTKPGTITGGGPTSKWLGSGSTVGQIAARRNFTLSKRAPDVCVLPLEFHLTRIYYTESLDDKSSARYKKLEREVMLTLNKMLSFHESFLQANILHFLKGSVIVQSEAVFRGEGSVPTPSDMIRTVITAVEKKEMDTFFDWRVDLKSLRCNGYNLKNLDPEILAITFTVLGQGSIATFGGLTDWGPLEIQRNEVVWSLGARYGVRNFSLVQVRNIQGDLDISGEIFVNTDAHVDIDWALEALKGLANFSVDLGSICINGSRLRLQIFPVSFLVTNRIFSEKLLDRSSGAHQSLSWDLSKTLMHILGQYKNLLQVTIREVRGGSLICLADVIFQPPAPTSEDLVRALALAVGPKNYLGASRIQVDPFSFTVAGVKVEPAAPSPRIPGYGIALIVLSCLAVTLMPIVVFLYTHFGQKGKMVIHKGRDPEVTLETIELDNPGFRSLAEVTSQQSSAPTEALG